MKFLMNNKNGRLSFFLLLLLWLSAGGLAWGQGSKSIVDRLHTDVNFELVLPRIQPNGLAGQQWGDIFRQYDVLMRVRQPLHTDKIGIKQQVIGTTRRVTVTAMLDRKGDILLPDRRFSRADVVKLGEWIQELKTYGAQGAPEGEPMWGLQRAEYDRMVKTLREKVAQPTSNAPLDEAIKTLEMSADYPLLWTNRAKQQSLTYSSPTKNNVMGAAKGTGLSVLLREAGLVFRPKRLPDESIVYEIDLSDEISDPWPIGWDPDPLGLTRLQLARDFYVPARVEVAPKSMTEFLAQLEEETKTPVYIDGLAIDSLGLNFDEIKVSYPRRQTSWSLALRTLVSKMKLTQEIRIDENDRAFIWITRFQAKVSKPGL